MICSTIIPTIGRQSLTRAVYSVLQQNLPAGTFEVIVVNDSGTPLEAAEWMKSPQVKILETQRHNRSVARNTGAAVAKGEFLHFLDDDDWILPDAFQNLWERAQSSKQAGWVFGGFRLVTNDGEIIQEFHPPETGNCFVQLMAAEWIPLQASWIRSKAFFNAGGFTPLNFLEGGFEDIHISRQVAYFFEYTQSPKTVAVIRFGDSGSTTNYTGFVNQNRQSREIILSMPGAFNRMREAALAESARSKYWHGKIIYFYLASLIWNLKKRNVFTAASRLFFILYAFALSILYILSPDFWQGAAKQHHNFVRSALNKMGEKLYSSTAWEK